MAVRPLRTGAALVARSVLRQPRGPGTDSPSSWSVRAELISHPWNQLRNEIPRGCGQARRVTSQIVELRETEGTEGADSPSRAEHPSRKGEVHREDSRDRCNTEFLQRCRGSRFISGRTISTASGLFAKLLHGTRSDRRMPRRTDGERVSGDRRTETKKGARLFLYLCVVVDDRN